MKTTNNDNDEYIAPHERKQISRDIRKGKVRCHYIRDNVNNVECISRHI